MATKITVKVPTKKEKSDAGRQTAKGHSSGGRVLAEASKAKEKKKVK